MVISITTSNLNGIRAAKRKDMYSWVEQHAPDVWAIQEVRAPQSEIDPIFSEISDIYVRSPKGASMSEPLTCQNEICRIKGRAGVGLLSALPVVEQRYGLFNLEEDVDSGRWIESDIRTPEGYTITVVSVYVHAGNVDHPDKMEQKFRFLEKMTERMRQLQDIAAAGGNQAVLCGDFNIAHTLIDIKNAKSNEKSAGFLPEERVYIDKWLDELEYVDVMRDLAGEIQGPYTWWSQRGKAFDNDTGWRIDYQFATPELAHTARGFRIDKAPSYDTRWSDHAALTITYEV